MIYHLLYVASHTRPLQSLPMTRLKLFLPIDRLQIPFLQMCTISSPKGRSFPEVMYCQSETFAKL